MIAWLRRGCAPRPLAAAVVSGAPGVGIAALIALIAIGGAHVIPLVGAPVLALAVGIVVATIRRPPARCAPGLKWTGRYVLQTAIVVLGATLHIGNVLRVGIGTLPVMLGTLAVALSVAFLVGRALGIDGRLRTLIGVGTGICGASAIGAVSGVIAASEAEIAYAISTIFLFNLAAVVIFPPIGHALGMSQHGFGLWAGTAVNDTSSVVATAYSYGHQAGVYAVIVKLTRTTLILPIVAVLAIRARSQVRTSQGPHWARTIPWFLLWFAAAAIINSLGWIPTSWSQGIANVAIGLITVALAAIGLSTRLGEMRRVGYRPLLLGTTTWAAVAVTGLVLQSLFGSL